MAFCEQYMLRAIELARKGKGAVNPNPLVGAVIVKDGRIIGEGYHASYGTLHAERDAFANLTEDATGAEMYVTLEPCCHYGKQPPCVEAIVEHKIAKVYVGSDDPNEKVAGKGIIYLKEHGIAVETHCMKEECDALNYVFFHYITTKKPYVIAKYAMTMDGKIASYTGKSQWISNETSRALVQEMRNEYVGIMVGIGTVLTDNPMLTCRIPNGRNPIRLVCDTRLRIPLDCKLVQTADVNPTIVAYGAGFEQPDKLADLETAGVVLISVPVVENHIDLKVLMNQLGERQIDSILLEGGGMINYSAFEADIVNEVDVFVAPKILGGETARTPVEGKGFENPDLAKKFSVYSTEIIDGDVYIRYRKEKRN